MSSRRSRLAAETRDSIVDSMADTRVVAVTDATGWVRNLISIVINSGIGSAALGARHQKWVGPVTQARGRMTGRVDFEQSE